MVSYLFVLRATDTLLIYISAQRLAQKILYLPAGYKESLEFFKIVSH
jgi:hypothetical protein